jgi:hypothetical protein
MRLRQVALVAADLEPVVADLCAVLDIEVAFRDPAVSVFGLANSVMPVGDTFLEVVSPVDANASAARYLKRRRGDGGYMVILQTDDLEADRRRIERIGVRVVWSIDLDDARAIHLHPRDVGGAIVSLDSMTPPSAWRWAGPGWRDHVRTDVVSAIAGVELQSDEPRTVASRWAELLSRPAEPSAGGAWRIGLDHGEIRFVPAADDRGEGVRGVDLVVRSRARLLESAASRGLDIGPDHVEICGTRLNLR